MHIMAKFLTKFFRQIGTPLAQQAEKLCSEGEWRQLQELTIKHPSEYPDAASYQKDAAVVDMFRKALLPGDKKRRIRNAKATFWASETQCAATNVRLTRYLPDQMFLRDASDVAVADFINRWRKEVKRVLGRVSYVLETRFSPGSTLSDKGKLITIPDKMSSVPTCYESTLPFYRLHFMATPQWEANPIPTVVRSNRFFTVPKDSFKDRGCCVEASVNVQLQLGVGSLIKSRMESAYKVKLEHLPLRHKRLACLASAGRRDLATIDLSNASDTVSKQLVRLILPPDWFELLNSLRATHTKVDRRLVFLEKFSSMGNGFTFELETLLFRTLCDTVIGGRHSSAFGDDMIVPSEHSTAIIAALRFFGFEPNDKKTFCDGPFRESCGGDYFNGVNVRSHFIKELPDEPHQWIALANGLSRLRDRGLDVTASWRFCLDQLPLDVRKCRGPVWLGDTCIHDPSAEPVFRTYSTTVAGRKHVNSPTFFWRIYRPVTRTLNLGKYWSYRVATAAGALGIGSELSPRASVTGHKLDWVAAWGRNDFFGWLEV